jgi:hypothetical protein
VNHVIGTVITGHTHRDPYLGKSPGVIREVAPGEDANIDVDNREAVNVPGKKNIVSPATEFMLVLSFFTSDAISQIMQRVLLCGNGKANSYERPCELCSSTTTFAAFSCNQ